MAHKTALTKISVSTEDGRVELWTINKNESLETNVKEICRRFSMPSDTIFALKFAQTNDGTILNTFVTEDNYDDIKDGFSLKITYSLEIYVKRIFENMNNMGRPQSFEDLHKLCSDPGFIKEMVKQARIENLMELLANELTNRELTICLTTLLNLLKKNYVQYLPPEVFYKVIGVIKSGDSKPELLQPALAVLCQILFLKGPDFYPFKQEIINQIHFNDLMPYLWSEDEKFLQLNALMLINTLAKLVKSEKRQDLVKEMYSKQNREKIFTYVIGEGKRNVEPAIAHELHVYQSHIMSLYKDALETYVDPTKDEFELNEEDDSILNFLQERRRQNSTDTVPEDFENIRLSIASTSTRESIGTINSGVSEVSWPLNGHHLDLDRVKISRLALENLRYYKNRHPKNFKKSLIEETTYEVGIYETSEIITQTLAELVNMGRVPEKQSQCFQPLLFNTKLKYPFFPELFARTMWLLSKTRREMKASTKEDYPKVLQVLKKQLTMVMERKPINYRQLTNEMDSASYKEVSKTWAEEKSQEWDVMLATNPNVQEFKVSVIDSNEKLIALQRIGVLQKGEKFPKLPQKKGKLTYIYVKLSETKRTVQWCDWDFNEHDASKINYINSFRVADIKHFIVGKACPHVKDHTVKEHTRAFTLMVEDETVLNFFAKDVKTASYWIDGFNILLEKENRSDLYKNELDVLVKMDCTLQLLELQEVDLPNSPPPVPPLPPGYGPKPALPPKSDLLLSKSKKNQIYDQPR